MTYLEVPGASLYHEVVGSGPVLLCISGADGSCEIWRGLAQCLKDHFTVVTYDRRGFSRSWLKGAQDYANRLETDADDAAHLIKHLSPQEPATVIGNSSGAIVSLKLLSRHPDIIKNLLPYEPPAATFLPDYEDLKAFHQDTYATYRANGMQPAFLKFMKLVQGEPALAEAFADVSKAPYMFSNIQYWFEREFMYYPLAQFDVDGELRPSKDKLILVNGELSKREPYQYRANAALAEKLGLTIVHLPGEHVGHATHPAEFAQKLAEVLKAKEIESTKV